MPTLEDVARKAGVSTATVSKVLSNTPYFTQKTRDKVMQAVRELGYVPNLAARALSSGKTHIVAIVFPYVYDTILTDPLVVNILEGIEVECSAHSYNMLLSTPRMSEEGADQNYLQLVQSGYLDGIIALDTLPMASVLDPAREKGIPSVAIGYHAPEYHVRSDDFSGGYALLEHVHQLGHQHIGIISVPEKTHYSIQKRMDGIRAAIHHLNLDPTIIPECDGDFSTESGIKCAARLLEQHPDLTALVCLNDRMAIGAIQQAKQSGRRVPDDLTVVGYDDLPLATMFSPPLTTVTQHAFDLGQAAAAMLFEVLSGSQPEPVELPTELIIRQSSGPVPARRSNIKTKEAQGETK